MTALNAFKKLAAIGAIGCLVLSSAQAAPISGVPAAGLLAGNSGVENVRTYCYNRHTGQFKHWGPCTGVYRVCAYDGCRLERRFW